MVIATRVLIYNERLGSCGCRKQSSEAVLTLPTPGRPSSSRLLDGWLAMDGTRLPALLLLLSAPLAAARMMLSTSANRSATPAGQDDRHTSL